MPTVMAKIMVATTSIIISIHFDLYHTCRKHNVLFTMDHVEACCEIQV